MKNYLCIYIIILDYKILNNLTLFFFPLSKLFNHNLNKIPGFI